MTRQISSPAYCWASTDADMTAARLMPDWLNRHSTFSPSRPGFVMITSMDKTLTRPEVDRLHVFYDGGCPLCRREIQHYRRLASEKEVAWIDIERDVATLRHFGLQQTEALRRMHAYSPNGQWLIGVYAFLAIWYCIPRYRWAARCITALRLDRPLQWLYQLWAERRFERARCAGRCNLPNA